MRLPIKLNQAGWPRRFARLSFAFHDPRPLAMGETPRLSPRAFSEAISSLQFGVTFKTTHPGRQEHSNRFLTQAYRGSKPVILDVGASDGSTSLDLIRLLDSNFARYYVTDLNLSAVCGHDPKGVLYFLDHGGRCCLRASGRFLVYSEVKGAIVPFRLLANILTARFHKVIEWREVLLIQPELAALAARDSRISIRPYDMFRPWTEEPPDVIKIANLLNAKYFTETQMREALAIQCANLAPNGRLLLVSEDDDVEKFSVFRKSSDGMRLEHAHGPGAKAAHLVPTANDFAPEASQPLNQAAGA